MILVDTSIWIDHLRAGDAALSALLEQGEVLSHPWVTGELALGIISNRAEVIGLLGNQAHAVVASDDEILRLIEFHALHGTGIGYVDAQLLAATLLTPDARLWTRDKRLAEIAGGLGIVAETGAAGGPADRTWRASRLSQQQPKSAGAAVLWPPTPSQPARRSKPPNRPSVS